MRAMAVLPCFQRLLIISSVLHFYSFCVECSLVYYIPPSPDVWCPQLHCLSLSEFASNTSYYIKGETEISLFLLSGNHFLDVELTLINVDKFTMIQDTQDNGSVSIECTDQLGRFNVSNSTSVSIIGVHFVGCGGNSFALVNQFLLVNSFFEGLESTKRALVLHVVANATVVNCSFNSYSFNSTNNSEIYAGGVIIAFLSSVNIKDCTFSSNTAPNGAVLYVFTSSVVINDSVFTENMAKEGGVIYSFSKNPHFSLPKVFFLTTLLFWWSYRNL